MQTFLAASWDCNAACLAASWDCTFRSLESQCSLQTSLTASWHCCEAQQPGTGALLAFSAAC